MFCKGCEQLTLNGGSASVRGRALCVSDPALQVLLCERCGAVLATDDDAGRMLNRLKRFGLGAESLPLLSRHPED